MNCIRCSKPLSIEREIKNKVDCEKCANLGIKKKGIMVISHKTGSEIQIVSDEVQKMYKHAHNRKGQKSILRTQGGSNCIIRFENTK